MYIVWWATETLQFWKGQWEHALVFWTFTVVYKFETRTCILVSLLKLCTFVSNLAPWWSGDPLRTCWAWCHCCLQWGRTLQRCPGDAGTISYWDPGWCKNFAFSYDNSMLISSLDICITWLQPQGTGTLLKSWLQGIEVIYGTTKVFTV